jgi:hypothetical protein
MTPHSIALVAVDHGPRDTLRPLAAHWGAAILGDPAGEESEIDWDRRLREYDARGLVCGTSDTVRGRAIESAARRSAARLAIPVVAVEDYPGNYRHFQGAGTDLLVVESDTVAGVTRARLGVTCPRLAVSSPARYDAYRIASRALRARTAQRWAEPGAPRTLLWAGQPETPDCLRTLKLVLPLAAKLRYTVLFKAHPRDAGYDAGAYRPAFAESGATVEDVTGLSVADALSLAPRAVVTQFSSVAIEAGFYGIPGLCVLLPDAGGARLREKKGYGVPPHCEAGAGAFVVDAGGLENTLSPMLEDGAQREFLVSCFDAYFHTGAATLPHLLAVLASVFERGKFAPEISNFM